MSGFHSMALARPTTSSAARRAHSTGRCAGRGIVPCRGGGQRGGWRLPRTRRNCMDLHDIFNFIEAEGIQRACFYHLVYSGRGNAADELTTAEIRRAMDIILERTRAFHERGLKKEIL